MQLACIQYHTPTQPGLQMDTTTGWLAVHFRANYGCLVVVNVNSILPICNFFTLTGDATLIGLTIKQGKQEVQGWHHF